MQIFICSTCYDLIDLRAELNVFIREAGVGVLLSDYADSEFHVHTERNSIETCLANVRKCDHFVIVLSSRYGPSLAKAGYEDISAMHLEYREAQRCGKPVHMYVRDRLEADFAIWKRNGRKSDIELSWCRGAENQRVLALLEEHRTLSTAAPKNNWFWTFRDSMELKLRLSRDFSEIFNRAMVGKLFQAARVPLLEIRGRVAGYNNERLSFELLVRNLSEATALSPTLAIKGTSNTWRIPGLAPKEEHKISAHWHYPGYQIALETSLTYSILEGHVFRDDGKMLINFSPADPASANIVYEISRRDYVTLSSKLSLS